MKLVLKKTLGSRPITVCGVLFILIAPTHLANADPLKEARVSQVIQDVRLLEAHAAPHPAALNDKVALGSAVRTGAESRAELTFNDLTITRLGANTIFSFTSGARQAELTQGAILLQVKPGAPAVRANTTAVTVAVMGGTALLSTGPPTKFMVLEGIGTIYPLGHPEKAVTVHGGEMVTAEGGRISKPEKFDVKLVLATSALIVDFPPLANLPLILAVMDQQQAEQFVMVSNPPPYKSFFDVIDVTSQNADANPAVIEVRLETPTPSPTEPPPPSKFGTPSTITAPNPYLITSGTTITTDPSITTNGVTDFGKIYRGVVADGAFTLWAFGSTSAFDNAINLDTEFFADPNHLPIAAFKFQSLSLNGNPTIDLSNGGVTKLAFIGVDGITSGPPGGVLTFTGLDLLVLATVNGSINLTSDVSFQNLNELAMYARGAGSNLILNSPISNIGILKLAAEGSIQLTNPGTMSLGEFDDTAGDQTLDIGGSLLLDGQMRLKTLVLPGTTVASGANLTLNITGDYTNSSATEFSLLHVKNEGGHIGTGGNIGVNIGGNLTTMSDFEAGVQNANGQIDNGGNLDLAVGGSTSTAGLAEYIDNTNGGVIDNGGNVTLHTVGPVMLDGGLLLEIDNFNGGTINNGADVTAHFVGDVTATIGAFHSFNFHVFNGGNDFVGDLGGGTIGTGGNIDVTFDGNAATGGTATTGSFSAQIANDHGNIGTGGNLSVTIGGNLTCGPWFTYTSNRYGGQIGTGGNITFDVAGNAISAGHAFLGVLNNGGSIGSGTNVTVNVGGDLTTQDYAAFQILNNDDGNGSGPGTIGGDATLNVSAANVSTGGFFDAEIDNFSGGHIGGSANISVTTVGGDLMANSLFAFINNRDAGTIGSGANITFDIGGDLITTQDATFVITNRNDGSGGGVIGGNVTLDLSAANISSGANLITDISANRGGHILGNAFNHVHATGNMTAQGALDFEIENAGFSLNDGFLAGGTIDTDATINVSATNISATTNYFQALIWNAGGGHIGGNALLDISASNGLTTGGDAYFSIINSPNGEDTPAGTIGGNATIQANIGSMSVGGLLDVVIDNTEGSIGGNATVNMNVTNATVTNDATFAIYGNDAELSSAININGGNYNVGGTFLSYIDGNGTITFNNATAHADVLKVGVFGANGVLNIGGGILSADSELKLYAPGSNGQLNFVSNVTLGGNSLKILAANSVTIFNNIVVTIGGGQPAEVYTNNANYTGFGGNGTTTGTFGGAGANNPLPLDQAPPFGAPPPSHARHGNLPRETINVSNTEELLALLDGANVGRDGRITVSAPTTRSNLRNLGRINMNALPREARRILMQQTRERSITRVGNRRIL